MRYRLCGTRFRGSRRPEMIATRLTIDVVFRNLNFQNQVVLEEPERRTVTAEKSTAWSTVLGAVFGKGTPSFRSALGFSEAQERTNGAKLRERLITAAILRPLYSVRPLHFVKLYKTSAYQNCGQQNSVPSANSRGTMARSKTTTTEYAMNLKTLVCLCLIAFVALLSPAAYAQTYSVIYTFMNGTDGAFPAAGLTLRGGVLYGTASTSLESAGNGTVFQLKRVGSQWIETTISSFPAGGYRPSTRVQFGPDGHLYGTTMQGGAADGGTIFRLVPPLSICKTANCMWTENVLHSFIGPPDGFLPEGGDMAFDQQGNIYGTTGEGGNGYLQGVVWKLTSSYTESIIHTFSGPDGDNPYGGLIIDSKGNLFGTTKIGGASNFGTVYELTYDQQLGWVETVLYSFQNGSDGQQPFGGLTTDASGNLYGATIGGGSGGGGTVYELSPSGNGWSFTVLYSLAGTFPCGPAAALAIDATGHLYGTTQCDGANGLGNVFKLTNTGHGWTYTSLHDFAGTTDGQWPRSNVTIDANGNLYGTTGGDGFTYKGNVWMIKP